MPDEIRGAFRDLDTLTDASGITARFSLRIKTGEVTCGIFKVFERDKRIEQTSFISEVLWTDYLAMVERASKRMVELQAQVKAEVEEGQTRRRPSGVATNPKAANSR